MALPFQLTPPGLKSLSELTYAITSTVGLFLIILKVPGIAYCRQSFDCAYREYYIN